MTKRENPDQSRILWVVLSALTVIAIVIAAGLFFFFPSEEGASGQPRLSSLSSETPGRDFDPVEFVRNADGYPEMVAPAETENEFSMGEESAPEAAVAPEETTSEPEELASEATDGTAEEDVPNVIEKTPAKPAETVKPAQAAPVAKAPETRKISVTVYWIQVGSYTDLTKAEEVRTYLLGRDVSSEIQTRSVDGTTYYRVRIGAFQSKGEADKFLDPIKDMKNFEDSYVVQTTMIREVPVNN
ncbi:SPOR domain-containing protein [Spirochaeta isovalerica]|uniref:DedD protein n=1 Tax=Spirochaeta isovalerica TaxID=150 RepID=A0A841RDW1_9SPIO|nr:SPOR domain-containing protein [Spirochaeta isovalerica]MBB6481571.1 DedD protein [Spirochaeta isovalerica]